MTRLRAEPDPAQRYPAAVARLRALIDEPSTAGTLKERIDRLLDRVALSTSEGIEVAPDRVNLLTLHSTKGLEFSRVYIVGVEDYQIPGLREAKENRQAEIQEARRLLYVGMTRTRERLVRTRVGRRARVAAAPASPLAAAPTISWPDRGTPVCCAWSRSNPGPESHASIQPRLPQ